MSIEIEIKFRDVDHQALATRLMDLGATADPPIEQGDLYLAHPTRDFAATDEALRLRRDGEGNCITYKGPKRGGPTKTREEIEVPFADGEAARGDMRNVFERLGFRPVLEVRKTRRSFHLEWAGRAMAVTLDLAEGLGPFAEVEAIAADDSDQAAAQAAVLDLAGRLGLDQVEPRSYLRMMIERAGNPAGPV